MTFKIKLEDKAAFLNRMEKQGEAVGSEQIQDNKLEGYFEVNIDDPKQLEIAKTILKQSPKINTLSEMEKKKLTKSELAEMVRQELQAVLAEKKKMKDEDKKEKLDENEELEEGGVGSLTDPNFIAGVATLLGVGGTILTAYISALKKAKTPEEKAKVKADLGKAVTKANLMV
jgi:hypothetical protein